MEIWISTDASLSQKPVQKLLIMAAPVQQQLAVAVIKQYPGPVQVARAVKVNVPGKHFPQLQSAEQKVGYEGTAVEFQERHTFQRHAKAWGAAHTGPGIRFSMCGGHRICMFSHSRVTLILWCTVDFNFSAVNTVSNPGGPAPILN